MLRFEVKKIFARTSNRIALLLLIAVLGITCWFAINITYVNENGDTERGFTAVRQLRENQKKWTGILTIEKLQQVINENQRIHNTPQAKSKDNKENEIAYHWTQGIREIRDLLNDSYSDEFRSYDYYKADELNPQDALSFYKNRTTLLKNWLEGDANDQFSQAEKDYLIQQYENLETPFYYDYMRGWTQLLEYAPTIIMIILLILGYLVASIFSEEFQWKSDAIFFSTVYGRNKAVAAKIKAGFAVVTILYFIIIILYSGIVLCYLGTDGASCPVQADRSGWKCFYNVLIWQKYLLTIVGGYIGCLFISFFTMLISAKTKSAVLAVMVPFLLLFIPSFLSNIESPSISKVLGLLPDRLLQINNVLGYFDLYEFGGKVVGAIPILLILYSILTIVLLPAIYHEYRHKQIY